MWFSYTLILSWTLSRDSKLSSNLHSSNGIRNSFKYFVGYNDNDIIRPLCMKYPQMSGYVRKFEGNTTMPFKINNKQLLIKYNQLTIKYGKKFKNYWK